MGAPRLLRVPQERLVMWVLIIDVTSSWLFAVATARPPPKFVEISEDYSAEEWNRKYNN